jgi:SPP1 gp7 family putative phage head morphogenesis protein
MHALDAEPNLSKLRNEARERSLAGRKAEMQYGRQLGYVARQVGDIVRRMAPDGVVADLVALIGMLNRYSAILQPWAESVASRMIADVSKRDAAAWVKRGRLIGRALKQEIDRAPTGAAMQKALAQQVRLITSLPQDAAQRVHKLTIEGMTGGRRASEIAAEIMKSGEVTKSRALLIAQTEVARTATALTQARAEYVGSQGYIWRTSKDAAVRFSHRRMEGKFVRWDQPPTLDGMVGHAGQFPRCRCFVEPVLDPPWSRKESFSQP